MKKPIISGLAIAVIALTSFNIQASDIRFPASNFQPKVVYMNEEATALATVETKTTEAIDSQYPAANFQPKVIYSDPSVQQSSAEPEAEIDPKYPAANFKPRVIYP